MCYRPHPEIMPYFQEFHNVDPSKSLLLLLVPSQVEHYHDHACRTYISLSLELSDKIPNAILCPEAP